MKNKGLIIAVIILVIYVLGLSGFIIYDKVLSTDNVNNENGEMQENNDIQTITLAEGFISKIAQTESVLKNESEYTVNYNNLSYTAYKNENNIIENIVITYKGKQINKDLHGDVGFHTLKSYYFDENIGLFIITLLSAPVSATPNTYIVAFDINGNIKIDDIVSYDVSVNTDKSILTYNYLMGSGVNCYDSTTNGNEIYSSIITYKYVNNEIEKTSKVEKTYKELPQCK